MCSLTLALEARTQWALHRIALIAEDVDGAETHLSDAQRFAIESGTEAYLHGDDLPKLLADVPVLANQWRKGWNSTDNLFEDARIGWRDMWQGTWNSDLDGSRETRASVIQTHEGYLPALEVSDRGGDCEPRFGVRLRTLEEATAVAREMESSWHKADC